MSPLLVLLLAVHTATAPAVPLVAPPLVTTAPQVDGVLADAEWQACQDLAALTLLGSGRVPTPHPAVSVCRDGAHLYIGARLPKPAGKPPLAAVGTRDGHVWEDDALEVFLDPGRTGSRYFQFIANSRGAQWDSVGTDPAWNATWSAAAHADAAADWWSIEIAIPFAALGEVPADGRQWGFNVAWDCQSPTQHIATWAPMRGALHQPSQFGLLAFAPDVPRVDLTALDAQPERGEALCSLLISAARQPVVLRTFFGPADSPQPQSELTVPAGQSLSRAERFALPLVGGLPARHGDFRAILAASVAGQDVYTAVIPMSVPQRLELSVRKFLLRTKRLDITADARPLATRHELGKLEVSLAPADGSAVAQAAAPFGEDHRVSLSLDLAEAPPGRYQLRAVVASAAGEVLYDEAQEPVTIPETPAWLANQEGISDRVLPPWTPLRVEGAAVRPWGREYRWGALPFPEGVTARDAEVLAGPLRLIAVVDGTQQAWMGGPPTFTRRTPARVEFTTRAEGQSASLRGDLWCEYDGCVRCDWQLAPRQAGSRLERLVFEIPYKAEHARYIYHFPGRWQSAFNAGAVPPDGLVMGFRPFVWLGDEWRGFSWFCPSDQAFLPSDPAKVTEVLRDGDVVLLRINLVEQPLVLDEPLRLTFGFEATPVRPNPTDVWDYRIIHTGGYGLEKQPWAPPMSVQWPAEGSINLDQGTVEAWVRPHFDPDPPIEPDDPSRGALNREFLNLRYGENQIGFYWNIDDRGMRLYLRTPEGEHPLILGHRNEWKRDEWHHVAFSWGDEVRIYGDGELLARRDWQGLLPGSLSGGTLSLGGGVSEFDVDDFCVSDIAREPRGHLGPLAPDDHTLLLESFDEVRREPTAARTVPTKAPAPGTVTPDTPSVEGKFGSALSFWAASSGRTALDMYQQLGVRTICFHEHWSTIQNYFAPEHPDQLHSLVRACHDRDIGLLVYYGYELADIAPEWDTYGEEVLVYPRAGGYHRLPEQHDYICCYKSAWQDYIAWAIARTMDEFDMDGVYLDGTANPWGCANLGHGCGYLGRDGKLHPTYTFFETREMMKRIYTIVKTRKPDGQVNVHQSTCMTIPTVGWATSYWDGEQFGGIDRGPDNQPLDVLPLDSFRAEFMGHNWGVPAELLCYGRPYTYPEALAIALPHDVLVRPNDVQLLSKIWKAAEAFGRKEARWLPYWENEEYVKVNDDDVKCSLYTRGSEGVLVVVSNLGKEPVEARLWLNRRTLNLPEELRGTDVIEDAPVDCQAGRLRLDLAPLQFRLIRIAPAR